ncbi:MAG: hypothetical protein GWN14_05225 [candidate division Zixibacteria bacterium]|nr:hypothetical protein [candidate division Zixibacteria bacterium]
MAKEIMMIRHPTKAKLQDGSRVIAGAMWDGKTVARLEEINGTLKIYFANGNPPITRHDLVESNGGSTGGMVESFG